MHILLDLDGNMVDWGVRWDEILDTLTGAENLPRAANQRSFNLKLGLTPKEQALVDEIFNHPDFYGKLKPIPGAVEAYHKMVEAGHHVQFATSPWWSNPTCLQGKADTVRNFFGEDALKKTILASDKTSMRGNILFDDKPEITGAYTPEWQQVLYDQPYNQDVQLPRIFSWETDEWRQAVEMVEAGLTWVRPVSV